MAILAGFFMLLASNIFLLMYLQDRDKQEKLREYYYPVETILPGEIYFNLAIVIWNIIILYAVYEKWECTIDQFFWKVYFFLLFVYTVILMIALLVWM
jgi:hypothetical protein